MRADLPPKFPTNRSVSGVRQMNTAEQKTTTSKTLSSMKKF